MTLNLNIAFNIDGSSLSSFLESIVNALDQLTQNVTANTNVINSAIALLGNLKTMLDAAGTDPVKLKALSDTLAANDAALAAAVAANTPVAPTP